MKKIVLLDVNLWAPHPDIPWGIGFIAAKLKKERISFLLYDQTLYRLSVPNLAKWLISKEPDIVGFSCYVWSIGVSARIADMLKAMHKECVIVFGGPYASGDPERVFRYCTGVDVIIKGDGEETFLELVTARLPEDLPQIRGISYRVDKQVFHTQDRPITHDLDEYPSPILENVFDLRHYSRHRIGLLYSRGCLQSCKFCAWGGSKPKFRTHSLDRYMEELEYIWRVGGSRRVIPHDGTFNYSKKFVSELCRRVRKAGFHFRWEDIDLRADLTSYEQLADLNSIGAVQTGFGYESANRQAQELIGKHLDIEALPVAVQCAKRLGMMTHCGFIVGLPGEGTDDVLRSATFARKIGPDEVGIFPLELFPGTEFYRNSAKYGIYKFEHPSGDPFATACETAQLSYDEKWKLKNQLASEFNDFDRAVYGRIAQQKRLHVIRTL